MNSGLHGYPTDVPYMRSFFHKLAPAWLDHVAIVSGFIPPARNTGFTFCELGCGQGVTTAILAATHPDGYFYGIDLMPSHVEHARRVAVDGAIVNVDFRATDFATAARMGLPAFDYIVAHGVYSWVNAKTQAALRAFVDRHLKPGGLVYVSYNAIPGRAADLPLQRLVRALGATFQGDSRSRYAAAADTVERLSKLKPPALAGSSLLAQMRKHKARFAHPYLVHELMSENWQVLCVTQVRAEMASIGLVPVGSATLIENFDSLVLGRGSRKFLAGTPNDDVRELVRDFLIDQYFRCDVFVRAGRKMKEDQRSDRLRASSFALARPRSAIKYNIATPAGRLRFGNPAARGIVSILSAGPSSLAEVIAMSPLPGQDVLANLLVLCAAGAVWPVEQRRTSVSALNEAIRRRLGGPEELLYLALPCGTAVAVDEGLLRSLRGGRQAGVGKHRDWREFLCSHGLLKHARYTRGGRARNRLDRRADHT